MSQSQHSAVHLGDDEQLIEVAHDRVEMHDRPRREAITREAVQATQAMEATASPYANTPPTSNDIADPASHRRDSSDDVVLKTNHAAAGVTSIPPPPLDSLHWEHVVNGNTALNQVLPSEAEFVRLSKQARDRSTPPPSTVTNLRTTDSVYPSSSLLQYSQRKLSAAGVASSVYVTHDGAAGPSLQDGKMFFGNGSSKTAASYRRRNWANTNAVTEQEADLTSKDRAKQKEAVTKFLAETVKSDWTWEWPRITPKPTSPIESPVVELSQVITAGQWKERDEWTDNASDGGETDAPPVRYAERPDSGTLKVDPFRFESPDGVGDAVQKVQEDRKRRRKKRLAEEMTWNDGLRCFSERRDAWTGARRVSRSPNVRFAPLRKQPQSLPLSFKDGGSSTAVEEEEDLDWEADTEIPTAPPFLPPENSMRKSVTPANYSTIYDKIILNQMTPMCPINLKDITRSCVKGWQRDGEWPPKSTDIPGARKPRRMSVAGLFGLDKHEGEKEKDKLKPELEKKNGEKSPSSPSIRTKLGKILHLRKDSVG